MLDLDEIELVILDVGGVLRDSRDAINISYRLAFEKESQPYNFDATDLWHLRGVGKYNGQEESIAALIAINRSGEDLHAILDKTNAETILDGLKRKYIVREDAALLQNLSDIARKHFNSEAMRKHVVLCEGAMEAIDNLIKIERKVAIFSNAGRPSIERDIPNPERFVTVLSEADVKRKKPFGDGIVKICKQIGIETRKTVYVGDAPTDILAARDAGCHAIAVLTGMGTKKLLESAKPDRIYDSLYSMSKDFARNKSRSAL